jgi:hypothetical protein
MVGVQYFSYGFGEYLTDAKLALDKIGSDFAI